MYCTLPDDDGEAEYVDLSLNPEWYTGYKGPSANRVWNTIYMENCFRWVFNCSMNWMNYIKKYNFFLDPTIYLKSILSQQSWLVNTKLLVSNYNLNFF